MLPKGKLFGFLSFIPCFQLELSFLLARTGGVKFWEGLDVVRERDWKKTQISFKSKQYRGAKHQSACWKTGRWDRYWQSMESKNGMSELISVRHTQTMQCSSESVSLESQTITSFREHIKHVYCRHLVLWSVVVQSDTGGRLIHVVRRNFVHCITFFDMTFSFKIKPGNISVKNKNAYMIWLERRDKSVLAQKLKALSGSYWYV